MVHDIHLFFMEIIIGFIAAFFTTFSMLPQAYRIWKLKEARDVSVWMPLMIIVGSCLWLIYGILIKEAPIIFANIVALLISLFTLFVTIKFR